MRHNYENLVVYQRSVDVAVKIMSIIDDVRPYKLAEQIAASAISIPSNIAEGCERSSKKEFKRFLEFSSGSTSELITQITVMQRSSKHYNLDIPELIKELKEINSMIRGLMNSLNDN